jgi:hypothetical protein
MNWLLKTLVGAVVAGLGWRLGADAYEAVKKQVQRMQDEKKKKEDAAKEGEKKDEKDKSAENGGGAAQTGIVGQPSAGGPSVRWSWR